jgi:hypothetical protein
MEAAASETIHVHSQGAHAVSARYAAVRLVLASQQ